MEVFTQRLDQEYDAQAVLTAPGVTYKAKIIGAKNIERYGGEIIYFSNPSEFPKTQIISEMHEPMVMGTIITPGLFHTLSNVIILVKFLNFNLSFQPDKYLGPVMSLCMEKRGVEQSTKNIDNERIMIQFLLPLNEIIVDFYDELKSLSSGFASFDYEDHGYELSNIVKVVEYFYNFYEINYTVVSHKK